MILGFLKTEGNAMNLREIYANTGPDATINFFLNAGKKPKKAFLASPFFTKTSPDPIEELTRKGCNVQLIVRFSPITAPKALQEAFSNKSVRVRYFTGTTFHTKLYIIDDVALVGSANLTQGGLLRNRELSVLVRRDRDEAFNDLCDIFSGLWNDADVLNEHVLSEYTKAFKDEGRPRDVEAFAKFIQKFIKLAAPKSVVVDSGDKSKERTFVQRLRRKYDEVLWPAYDEIFNVAKENGIGRSEFKGLDPRIEMDRFLCWMPRKLDPERLGQEVKPLSDRKMRAKRITYHVQEWKTASDTEIWGMYSTDKVIEGITNIRKYLCNPEEVKKLNYDDLFQHLTGCTAFRHREQYAPKDIGENLSPIDRMRINFQQSNLHEDVIRTVNYLLSGSGDKIERAYHCIDGSYELNGFGEACVMELLGWGDPKRPPFNNRSIEGIRLLGFDVSIDM